MVKRKRSNRVITIHIPSYLLKTFNNGLGLCECGCGQFTSLGKRFVYAHHLIGNVSSGIIRLGCKRNGKVCPSCGKVHPDMTGKNSPLSRPENAKRLSLTKLQYHPLRGKTYFEYYGEERAKEIIGRIRETREIFYNDHPGPMSGKHHTVETRIKMSKSKKGKLRNITYSKETLKQMSESHIGLLVGDKHPNWKGGIARLPYPFEFDRELKTRINKRDNYTCQNCGKLILKNGKKSNEKLTVHHINYNKKSIDERNLISLCGRCNLKANYDRNKWKRYYKTMIEEKYAKLSGN